ncbi:MAG: DUF5752 family protein [Candidatus Bathyarchaeia archaeon]|jgi:hypothetical protein
MSTHTHRTPDTQRLELNTKIIEILRTVPYEKGFHFYTAIGNFTKETATNLDSFEKKLQTVSADSVNFHLQRGDFQKWIKNTLGDDELAKRVNSISLTLPAKDQRKELLAIVQTRITELKRELPHQLSHTHS